MELKPISEFPSCCGAAGGPSAPPADRALRKIRLWEGFLFLVVLGAGWAIYRELPRAAQALTYGAFGLERGTHFAAAVEFFLYDTPKVLMLLTVVVFAVGILNTYFTAERTRRILAGRREAVGNVLAALLGVATPFCSCSAIPLFIGFVTAGIPLGVTFSFLIAAPMVNEVALLLLHGLLGWKIALLYAGTGIAIAVFGGFVLGRLRLERYIEGWVAAVRLNETRSVAGPGSFRERAQAGLDAVRSVVGRVWKWIVLGIAVGAVIHGYVPEAVLAALMGKEAWWSVPLAVGIGIPMYSNAAGMIPIVQALLGKGAALGTVLSFMMSVIALSLPEILILRRVLKPRLLASFVGIVALGILTVGWAFNALP
ncbi:MAG: permease [Desulfobacterales bacterium]